MAGIAKQALPIPARLPGLDGLRAIAVIAVLLFHADFYWARGGYLGVDLFFVISGFLITGLIARETDATGRFDLRNFYWRRARRLFPACWLMIAVVVIVAAVVARDALPRLRTDAIASFFYVSNWELLRHQVSYFEAIGRPPLLLHLWSLAIEEQFYIIWASLAFVLLPRLGRRAMAAVAIVLALASVTWMAVLAHRIGYPLHGDPSRLYFGTDTRGFALLLGAALGLLFWPRPRDTPHGTGAQVLGWFCGLLTLGVMVALFAMLGENTPTLYPWGLLGAAIAAAALIAVATRPGLAFGRYLDNPVLRWIGERSYGIYLWHWPVFMLTRPGIDVHGTNDAAVLALRITLTIVVAGLSYRWMETPIRRGALERFVARSHRHAWTRRLAVALALLLACGSVGAILHEAPAESMPAADVRAAFGLDTSTASVALPATPPPAPVIALTVAVEPTMHSRLPALAVPRGALTYTGHQLTAVGDSVLEGASAVLRASLPGADVHAQMGWQAADVINELETLKQAHELRPVVLVHLGTNGYVADWQLRKILSMLSDRKRVILVDTHVPRRWMEANNRLIARIAPKYPNVVVVHWSTLSQDQPDYFISDGVHLTSIGQRVFVGDIMLAGRLARDSTTTAVAGTGARDRSNLGGDFSPTLVLLPQPAASDRYWHRMARCETNSNWQQLGRLSGGLDIAPDDWIKWGGGQFAPIPAQATPAQQIEVANRISTQGWTNPQGEAIAPAGFAGWRCVAKLGRPRSSFDFTYTRESVLAQQFHLGERGAVVQDLQRILGVTPDGIYSKRLQRRHLAYLEQHDLPTTLAGATH